MNSTLHPRGAYHFGVAPAVVIEHPNPYRGLKGSCACDLKETADHINYIYIAWKPSTGGCTMFWIFIIMCIYIADYMESFAVVFKNIKNNDLEFQLIPALKYIPIYSPNIE
jgi:hypothetical protein